MCPHTTIYVSSYYDICVLVLTICVLILLLMCPHTTVYVSSYYYIFVPYSTVYVAPYYDMCPRTTIHVHILILLHMRLGGSARIALTKPLCY